MLNPYAAAYSEARAPNWTVFEVSAKYASTISFGLSPVVSATVTRGTTGKPVGGRNRGLKPPTASAKPSPRGAPERGGTGEHEATAQLRLVEHGVERHLARVEVEHADHVEVEAQDGVLVLRQRGRDPTEHEQPRPVGHRITLEQQGEIGADDRVAGAEEQLDEDPVAVGAALHREERAQRADQLGDVLHGIGREQDVAQLTGRQGRAHGVHVEATVGDVDEAEAVEGHEAGLQVEVLDRADEDQRRLVGALSVPATPGRCR